MSQFEVISEHRCFGGTQGYYQHDSREIGLPMKFSVYRPTLERTKKLPVLYYLAGLTCTHETFMIKAGAQRVAADLGMMLVACDTSPRGAGIAGEDESWDFGSGAGFYLDATAEPWRKHYRMYSYVTEELVQVVGQGFAADEQRQSIFGHSMGGHGALVSALRSPGRYRSVSAFAPVAAPTQCPWGKKAFSNYLGADESTWNEWDASALMRGLEGPLSSDILIDQGLADNFLPEQLYPEAFEAACQSKGQTLKLRRHEGYDHGYFFIATFVEDHLRHHHKYLSG